MTTNLKHWDIFCEVIDNYGDIGVTWRLAKQLSAEYHIPVKLWVDDLYSFQHILSELNPVLESQTHNNIEIILWNDKAITTWTDGQVIIEAFACELTQKIRSKLESLGNQAPLWLNLEYLSAEDWIDSIHGLPSLQNGGVNKYFFFPGFTEKSGGLICESDLFERQKILLKSPDSKARFLSKFNIEYCGQKIVSAFCYESDVLVELVKYLINDNDPTILLVPTGKSLTSISNALAIDIQDLSAGKNFQLGNLLLTILPMTNQEGFDELLWLSDVNIVRGEDSFIRAQWAKKPFIWHIYPQDEQTHIEKLNAFLERYCANLPIEVANIHRKINLAFNQGDNEIFFSNWKKLIIHRDSLLKHAQSWPKTALNGSDLARRLVEFVKNR